MAPFQVEGNVNTRFIDGNEDMDRRMNHEGEAVTLENYMYRREPNQVDC